MSRSEPRPDTSEAERQYIGRDAVLVTHINEGELHWYAAKQLGYKARAWPKRDNDCDDDRFNINEKENE